MQTPIIDGARPRISYLHHTHPLKTGGSVRDVLTEAGLRRSAIYVSSAVDSSFPYPFVTLPVIVPVGFIISSISRTTPQPQ